MCHDCAICSEPLLTKVEQQQGHTVTKGHHRSRILLPRQTTVRLQRGKCGHRYHSTCLKKWLYTAEGNARCPICREPWSFSKLGYARCVLGHRDRVVYRHQHNKSIQEWYEDIIELAYNDMLLHIDFPEDPSDNMCPEWHPSEAIAKILDEEELLEIVSEILGKPWPTGSQSYSLNPYKQEGFRLLARLTHKEQRWISKGKHHLYGRIGKYDNHAPHPLSKRGPIGSRFETSRNQSLHKQNKRNM